MKFFMFIEQLTFSYNLFYVFQYKSIISYGLTACIKHVTIYSGLNVVYTKNELADHTSISYHYKTKHERIPVM